MHNSFYWRRGVETTTPGTGTGGPCYDITGTIETPSTVTGTISQNIIRMELSPVPFTGLINLEPAVGTVPDENTITGEVGC